MKLSWNRRATADYQQILSNLRTRSESAADSCVLRVDTVVELIPANPRIGSIAEHLKSDVRFFVVELYVIYYRVQKSTVRILRLLHGSQDAACKLDC